MSEILDLIRDALYTPERQVWLDPDDAEAIAADVADKLTFDGWAVTCVECRQPADTNIRHRRTVPSGTTGEDAEIVCLWPCDHAYSGGVDCGCDAEWQTLLRRQAAATTPDQVRAAFAAMDVWRQRRAGAPF